ncbi:MAG: PAS domain-containing protein [Methanomicrobiales archaeon]|nr:PAS domain-containing protein [Methanomicrobiales archaeon]
MVSSKVQEDFTYIKKVLRENPQGMTVTDMAKVLGRTKNTVGRYMDILYASGQVEIRCCGTAKIFSLAQRVPFATILKHTRDLMIVLDKDLRILDINEPFLSLLNKSREEVVGSNIEYLSLADLSVQELVGKLATAIREKKIPEDLYVSNETEHFFKARILETLFEDDSHGFTVILIDLTEHKRMDEQLQASEKRFRDLVNLLPQPVFEANSSGILLFANQQAYLTFGYTSEELIDQINVWSMIAPEDRERARRNIAQMLQDGQPTKEEFIALRKDGTRFPIVDHAAPIYHGGQIVGFRGIVIDLTHRKEAEEELRRERDFIDATLHVIDALVLVLDREGRIVRFNHACEVLTGYTEGEVRGQPFWDIFLIPEEADEVKKVFAALVADVTTPLQHGNYWVTKNGERKFIQWSNTILRDEEGKVTYVIGTGIDHTGYRNLEQKLLDTRNVQ